MKLIFSLCLWLLSNSILLAQLNMSAAPSGQAKAVKEQYLDLEDGRRLLQAERLADLDISYQALVLEEEELSSLPATIGQYSELRYLSLWGQEALEELPEEIGQLQNLEVLILNSTGIKRLPASIGQLQNLRILDLGNCQLQQLPEGLGQLQALEALNLSANQLEELPLALDNCRP